MGTSNSYNTDTGIIMPKGFDNTNTLAILAAIKGMTTVINALIIVVIPRGHSDGYKGVKITSKYP